MTTLLEPHWKAGILRYMTKFKKYSIGVFLVLLILPIIVFVRDENTIQIDEKWLYIEQKPVSQSIKLVGKIEPVHRFSMVSPFEGFIKKISVIDGQLVEKNQILAVIDDSLLKVKIKHALAEYIKAQKEFDDIANWESSMDMARAKRALKTSELNALDTRNKLKDSQDLFNRGIIPRQELDSLKQQLALQLLDLKSAQDEVIATQQRANPQQIKILKIALDDAQLKYESLVALEANSTIRAPFSGIVFFAKNTTNTSEPQIFQEGSKVTESQPLFSVSNLDRLQVKSIIDESYLLQIAEGMQVNVTTQSSAGLKLKGVLQRISGQGLSLTANLSTGYDFWVALPVLTDKEKQSLRLGMSAIVEIKLYETDKAYIVPVKAIQMEGDKYFVWYKQELEAVPEKMNIEIERSVLDGALTHLPGPGFVKLSQ